MNQIWNIGHRQDCLFCLAPGSMAFGITKKGGAYLSCRACGTRSFIHGAGVRGPELIFGPMSLALKDEKPEVAQTIHQIAVQKENPNATVAAPG